MDHDLGLITPPFPNDIEDVDLDAVSDFLEREIRQLSLKNQYHINRDVNDMNTLASSEPVELSSMGLKALDDELGIIDNGRRCLRIAEKMGSKIIKEREFRLKFARAERFDAVKAATRIENYLKILRKNFGDESLKRPVQLTDLDKVCHKFKSTRAVLLLIFEKQRSLDCQQIMFQIEFIGLFFVLLCYLRTGRTGPIKIWMYPGIALS